MRLRALVATVAGVTALAAPTASAADTTDPLASQQWGLDQIHASDAWNNSTGAGQTIAVVDTGVDLGHPDLQSQLVPGATFACGGGPAPCGDGDWRGPDGAGQETDIHGTHVSGIAAAAANNGVGGAGVAPDAKIMPVKVLENGSGSFADIGAGIRYAADNGANVINLSLGAPPGSQLLTLLGLNADAKDAVAYAREKGVVVVASAGNETAPLCDTPSWEQGAMCVAASDRGEQRANYSNFGLKLDMKAVTAPGGAGDKVCADDIIATVPRGMGTPKCGQPDYDALAGTSMAAPHVSGLAALLTAQGRSADQVEKALMDTAHAPGSNETGKYDLQYGHGIVDAAAATAAP